MHTTITTLDDPPSQAAQTVTLDTASLPALRVSDRIALRVTVALIRLIERHVDRDAALLAHRNAVERGAREAAAQRALLLEVPRR